MTGPFAMLTVVLVLLGAVVAGHVMALQNVGDAKPAIAQLPAPTGAP